MASNADDAARLAAVGEGSVSRAIGLADGELDRFRRSLIDEVAAEHGFDPPALAHRMQAFIKQAGKESVDQRGRASLLIGEMARFFRGVLWQTAGLAPPCPDPVDRSARAIWQSVSSPRMSSSWQTAASSPITTSSAGCTCH